MIAIKITTMTMNNNRANTVLSNDLECVINKNDRYYVISKKQRICVIPYVLSNGMLDKIGVLKHSVTTSTNLEYTLMDGYVSSDDDVNLVAANRILFEFTGSNSPNANAWMYLGKLKNNVAEDLGTLLYSVNISDLAKSDSLKLNKLSKEVEFNLVDSNAIISTDESILLAAYLRLFQFFYINSLKTNND